MDDDRYPAIFERKLEFTLRLCSPDVVNAYGRDDMVFGKGGLPVQAKALTHNRRDMVMVSWPPRPKYIDVDGKKQTNPDYEYGMSFDDLCRSLGYEILSNVCHLDYDPKGR